MTLRKHTRRLRHLAVVALFLLPAGGCAWFDSTPVETADAHESDMADTADTADPDAAGEDLADPDPAEEGVFDVDDADDGPAGDTPGDPAGDEPGPDVTDLPVDVPEEETGPPLTCGDGALDDGEVCDDGNTVTEFCGGGSACLADCSLLEVKCGDGRSDGGEACDDGDDSSMDYCTTSCTINTHNIGAPCECLAECSVMDFTQGTISGCENVVIPEGSGGELACLRSTDFGGLGVDFRWAEGYCTLIAVECEGGTICPILPQPGDIDTFGCPGGAIEYLDVRIESGSRIRTKICLKPCSSASQCRWNAADEYWSECGQYDCQPGDAGAVAGTCFDARNLP